MMRHFIKILRENSDEFSTKGHADVKIRPNDARFGDNPLAASDDEAASTDSTEELDELDTASLGSRSSIDKLHDIFARAKVSDQEIKHGLKLTDAGMHKIAARLGVAPQEVQMLIAALTQQLRDDGGTVEENYQQFVVAEAGPVQDPFDKEAEGGDHLSAETDYLGDVTVRSAKHADAKKFYQGSKAADITDKLARADNDKEKQAAMRPLIEDGDAESSGFDAEIKSETGSYNFPWKLNGRSGFGTVMYKTLGDKPKLKLVSVRDGAGDDVQANPQMHQALLTQAQKFMNDA